MFVYTIQPVVKPVVQPVWQPVVSCKRGFRSRRTKLNSILSLLAVDKTDRTLPVANSATSVLYLGAYLPRSVDRCRICLLQLLLLLLLMFFWWLIDGQWWWRWWWWWQLVEVESTTSDVSTCVVSAWSRINSVACRRRGFFLYAQLKPLMKKTVPKKLKNVKRRKKVTKLKNVCKRWIKNVNGNFPPNR